jgi:hypothetical protein
MIRHLLPTEAYMLPDTPFWTARLYDDRWITISWLWRWQLHA